MPLIRIDVIENWYTAAQLKTLAQTVHNVMVTEFAAPERDRYQVITEHKPGQIISLDSGLGFERTDGVVVISITQQGRSADQKRAMYEALSRRLLAEVGVAPADLIVNVLANTTADWSFGYGRAQFLDGDL